MAEEVKTIGGQPAAGAAPQPEEFILKTSISFIDSAPIGVFLSVAIIEVVP